jgi:hypothetical protein
VAFDFPASPTNGTVSNGYTWSAAADMWVGGPGVSGPVTEQTFDPVGLVNLDIPVPSWAKGVTIDGSVYTTGAAAVVMRVSFDGTTFGAGASDYNNAAAQHSTGTQGYAGLATTANNFMYVSVNADSVIVPQNFSAEMNLTRPNSSALFHLKTYTKMYDSAATQQYRTWWGNSAVMPALSGTNLAIKAIRILHGTSGVAFPAGSFVRVKWLGDSAAIPATNAISDAPSDGNEYVRVNNIWRLKSQTFFPRGVANFEFNVPTGAKMLVADASILTTTQVANTALGWWASTDGTTFYTGATDYYYTGFIHYSGSSGYSNLPGANAGYGVLSFATDYTQNQPINLRWTMPITRQANTYNLIGLVTPSYYNSPATNYYTDGMIHTMFYNAAAGLSLKRIRVGIANTAALMGLESTFTVNWVY